MANTTGNQILQKIASMLPPKPGGPPLPKRELLKLLKRVRKALDGVIVKLEKSLRAESAPKRKPARKRTR